MNDMNKELIASLIEYKSESFNDSEIITNQNDGNNFMCNFIRLNGIAPMLSCGFCLVIITMTMAWTSQKESITFLLVSHACTILFYFALLKFNGKVFDAVATLESHEISSMCSTEEAKKHLCELAMIDISRRSASFYLELLEHCPAKQSSENVQNWCCEWNHPLMTALFILSESFASLRVLDMFVKATRPNSIIIWVEFVLVFSCAFLDIMSVMRLHATIDMLTERLYLKAKFDSYEIAMKIHNLVIRM